jgi:hypothetical protein
MKKIIKKNEERPETERNKTNLSNMSVTETEK